MIETLVALLVVLPLVGVVINALFVRQVRQAGLVASGVMGVAFIVALVTFALLLGRPAEERTVDFMLYQWIQAGPLSVPFGLMLDPLSMVMVLLITGVGLLIHIYSIGYMSHDSRPVRYFVYLNLFVASMLVLVLANNYLLMFLGWEGVGLCSYLLIGHSFERRDARDASLKAFIINRIGDIGLLLAILLIYRYFGTLIYQQVFSRALEVLSGVAIGPFGLGTLLAFLIFIGVAGKSAQIPLFIWLPDAMAGPTPASALIHAATMVTSGVYLIARSNAIWVSSALPMQNFLVMVAALTAFVAASIAIGQYDIKKVLAYSTVSQLGFMVAAVAAGHYTAGIFHLLTHGVFKALLFLAAGAVIHGTGDVQDMRRMGGLRSAMPRTFWTYVVGALALSGIFPFAGFWSKDEIIGQLWTTNWAAAVLLIITSMLTAFYMARQISLVFLGTPRDPSVHAHESEPIMTTPLVILAVLSLLVGFINIPFFHLAWLHPFLDPVFSEGEPVVNYVTMILTLALALLAGFIGWRVYAFNAWRKTFKDPLIPYLGVFFEGFETAWGSDTYVRFFMQPFRAVARWFARVFDPRGIDGAVNGVARLVGWSGEELRLSQTGYLRSYTLVFLVGAVAVIGYFSFIAMR